MASRLFRSPLFDVITIRRQQYHRLPSQRGKRPEDTPNLQQRLAVLNYKDPELSFKVNIGLAVNDAFRKFQKSSWISEIKKQRSDPDLERKSRNKELLIDLEKAREDWLRTIAPSQIYQIAQHYGIYQDLYGDAYFYPVVPLEINYDFGDEDLIARVYTGNIIASNEAKQAPSVTYKAKPDSLWTLLLTTPDGNLSSPKNEYVHWFIGNIPGNEIEKGEQLVDYLRPIPARGIGYCRYIFVLYKQDKRIDYSEYKKEQPCLLLEERNWKTLDFYRQHQDYLTPAGLAFFQATWDLTLTDFYHHVLEMPEPIFQYDFPKPYIKPQTWFPLREPFNLYMDKYRDPKQINKEYLLEKLKKVHPFKEPEPPLKFPNAHSLGHDKPSWLKLKMKKDRLGWGRINEIE